MEGRSANQWSPERGWRWGQSRQEVSIARETGKDFRQTAPIKPARNSHQPQKNRQLSGKKKKKRKEKSAGAWSPGPVIQGHTLKAHPPVPSASTPLHPKACGNRSNPSGHRGREEVGLASDRGCKAASHAHRAGRHQEIKLPRHSLQQRSSRTGRGSAGAGESARDGVEGQKQQRDGAAPEGN